MAYDIAKSLFNEPVIYYNAHEIYCTSLSDRNNKLAVNK
ncbi:MAG: hypothetical protein JWR61_4939 [Ferruginibacter sp.]|jgi:hypothetical protein|nr:hypothetical protein [Ferruginibacter sp.]